VSNIALPKKVPRGNLQCFTALEEDLEDSLQKVAEGADEGVTWPCLKNSPERGIPCGYPLNGEADHVGLVTFMNLRKISHSEPGTCFSKSGWLLLALLMPLFQGCNDRSSSSTQEVLEVRGQPIRPDQDSTNPSKPVAGPGDQEFSLPPERSVSATQERDVEGKEPSEVLVQVVPPLSLETSAETVDSIAASDSPPLQVSPGGTAPEKDDIDGFTQVSFDRLSGFEFEVSDELLNPSKEEGEDLKAKTESQIPKEIKNLDQAKVALKGFMLPLKVEGGLVTELLVMRDQSMCCFGTVPKINEWVSVTMRERGVKPIMDQPITLFGKLNVGEMRENGYLVGIYSMDGESMAGPLDH